MSRAHLNYSEARAPVAATGFSPDVPVAGLYKMRLVSGGVNVAVRIWFGPPNDPVTGEELDRGWRWQATGNGDPLDLDRAWPKCADAPIPQAEYDYLCGLQAWARGADPTGAVANPKKKLDLLSSPLVF
jgi:hypothetical protein